MSQNEHAMTDDQQRLLRAWREIKSRPILLPLSWFQHVDDLEEKAAARERFNGAAGEQQQQNRRPGVWNYTRYGRALGMLVGGALGDSLGALGPASVDDLLAAARPSSGTGIRSRTARTDLLLSGARAAVHSGVELRRGGDADEAFTTGIARGLPKDNGDLGCLAVSVPVALGSAGSPDEVVFRRGMAAAELLSDRSEDRASAAVLAVALARALADGDQDLRRIAIDSIERLNQRGVGEGLRLRLEFLAENARAVEKAPLDEALAKLGDGSSGPEVVTRALYLTWRFGSGGRAELHAASAAQYGAVSAAVCGLLTGARFGAGAFPQVWRRRLTSAQTIEELAADLFEEYGPPQPTGMRSPSPSTQLTSSAPRTPEQVDEPLSDPRTRGRQRRSEPTVLGAGGSVDERRDRLSGAVLGFAIGDRLGSAVADLTWPEIQEQFGSQGISRYAAAAEPEQLRSSSLKLALSLDILIRADQARVGGEDPDLGDLLDAGYQRCAERFPDFANDVIAESAAHYPIDPDFRPSLMQVGNSADEIVRYLPMALWTEVYPRLFPLVRQAASGLGDAEAASVAGFVVLLQLCIFSKNPVRAVGMVQSESGELSGPELRTALMKAERVARRGITPAEIEQLGTGDTATEAIAIAVCAAESAEYDFDESLRIAVNHSGNSSATGALCGALLGASLEGVQRLSEHWLKGLTGGRMLYRLAQDAGEQFGPQPPDSAEWRQRYPATSGTARTAPPQPIEPHERFMGSMLAGAVGDSLGFAIEFDDIGTIRRKHGDAGLTDPVLRDGVAQVSDDTQMMLFTLEGLIRAHVARRMNPVDNDPVPEVQHAYQRWYHTQYQPWDQAGGPYAQRLQQPDGWLITRQELFSTRAPGSTCMSALRKFAQTHQHATPQHTINDSKGCGGVMRAAPVAVWSGDPAEVFYAAVGTAALTHSHPSGYLSAGVLAVIVHQLIRDVSLPDSVRLARELLLRWRGHEEQLQVLDKAVELARKGPVSPEELKDTLGQGWVGEEALAIGLYAVLATDNLRDALLLSVNHSGDSDSTGIVAGNIGGALYGTRAIPQKWLNTLELREIVETLAKDALAEFSPGPPSDQAWLRRYPAW
ncbi:ADP-ribosylglycohydrolase family protein [Saccharopolyspora sp. NPDC002686]|uniref:ADP-ribosylglycohydrolase family protein n=1 Tax=Saccharopolyspora sp. NPDC002686 TaxID=3154541 RepID=UPI00332F6EEB